MRAFKTILLSVVATFVFGAAEAAPSGPTSYDTASAIACKTDELCRGIYRVEIRQHTVGGVTGTAWATWATSDNTPNGTTISCPGIVDGLKYLRPAADAAGIGCFTITSPQLAYATGLPVSTGVSGLGTGVSAALANNVGASGAVLVNGSNSLASVVPGAGFLPLLNGGAQTAAKNVASVSALAALGTDSPSWLHAEIGATGVYYDWYSPSLSAAFAPFNVSPSCTPVDPGVNPGDPCIKATGVPTSSGWVIQTAARNFRTVTYASNLATRTIYQSDNTVFCDSSSGNVRVIAPTNLGSSTSLFRVRIEKTSADYNYCAISQDGTNDLAWIVTPTSSGGISGGWLDVEVYGATLRTVGAP